MTTVKGIALAEVARPFLLWPWNEACELLARLSGLWCRATVTA